MYTNGFGGWFNNVFITFNDYNVFSMIYLFFKLFVHYKREACILCEVNTHLVANVKYIADDMFKSGNQLISMYTNGFGGWFNNFFITFNDYNVYIQHDLPIF